MMVVGVNGVGKLLPSAVCTRSVAEEREAILDDTSVLQLRNNYHLG